MRHLVKAEWVKNNSIILDVGINKAIPGDRNKIVGDVDFEACLKKVKLITPVPGGVGPMTVAMLIKNMVKMWAKKFNLTD